MRKCSPYHADGQFRHDKAKVLGHIKAADFNVISARIRQQRPSEDLGLSDYPRSARSACRNPCHVSSTSFPRYRKRESV